MRGGSVGARRRSSVNRRSRAFGLSTTAITCWAVAHASHLAVEVVALVGRGHPCGDGGEAAAHPPGLEVTNQDELAHFARRDRDRARPEPPIGGLRMDVLLPRPLTKVHER